MSKPRQFCTFFLNEIYFGIEVEHVQEVVRYQQMTRVPLAPLDVCGLINLRGQIVTAIDLRRRLEMRDLYVRVEDIALMNRRGAERSCKEGFPPGKLRKNAERRCGEYINSIFFNVVVRTNDEVVSLLVDEVGDILETTEDNFEPPPATLKGKARQLLRGAYKLKDELLLVLDVEKVLEVK